MVSNPSSTSLFHHDELRHAVDHDGILQCHQIHPTATAVASRHGTVFVSYFAKRVACLVEQLYGGNGPEPTRVLYALKIPNTSRMSVGPTPSPVHTPPLVVLEELTKG